jgi:hypothetical protein
MRPNDPLRRGVARVLAEWGRIAEEEGPTLPVCIPAIMRRQGWTIHCLPLENPTLDALAVVAGRVKVVAIEPDLSAERKRFVCAWMLVQEMAGRTGRLRLHSNQPDWSGHYTDYGMLRATASILIPAPVLRQHERLTELAAACMVDVDTAGWRVRWATPQDRVRYVWNRDEWRMDERVRQSAKSRGTSAVHYADDGGC